MKALAMKKWFNTNYHYIVLELEDDTEIFLSGSKPFDEYQEAKNLGITPSPVVIGPFTFLKLCRTAGSRTKESYVEALAKAYATLLTKADELGIQWLQLDEPYLVRDLSETDIALFRQLYDSVLPAKGRTKLLLATYFGDIRDCYPEVTALNFDGIGLDFIEGKQTLALVRTYGFPKEKTLFAGVANGRNIWRNRYQATCEILKELKGYAQHIVISTSCSLLYVPYTLDGETKLTQAQKWHFAFAHEKLKELSELGVIAGLKDPDSSEAYRSNCEHLVAAAKNIRERL